MSAWWFLAALWPVSGMLIPGWVHTKDHDLTLGQFFILLILGGLGGPLFLIYFVIVQWMDDRSADEIIVLRKRNGQP